MDSQMGYNPENFLIAAIIIACSIVLKWLYSLRQDASGSRASFGGSLGARKFFAGNGLAKLSVSEYLKQARLTTEKELKKLQNS